MIAWERTLDLLHTFSWIGFLFMIGCLLGEYCVGGRRFYSPQETSPNVKKKRTIYWLIFSFFFLSVLIPAI